VAEHNATMLLVVRPHRQVKEMLADYLLVVPEVTQVEAVVEQVQPVQRPPEVLMEALVVLACSHLSVELPHTMQVVEEVAATQEEPPEGLVEVVLVEAVMTQEPQELQILEVAVVVMASALGPEKLVVLV